MAKDAARSAGSRDAKDAAVPEPLLWRIREALLGMPDCPTRDELEAALPEPAPRREFARAIGHLKEANKVVEAPDGAFLWVAADTPELRRLVDEAGENILRG